MNYFALCEGGTINKMKALKLIWLSDRLHLRRYGRPILNDTYFALSYGPVASNTKDLAENTDFLTDSEKEYRNAFIENSNQYYFSSLNSVDGKVFSKTDLEMMGAIYKAFGNLSEFELSEESHKYPEWKKFEGHLKSKSSSRFEMNYEDFFENPETGDNSIFSSEKDLLQSTKELFLENGYIYRLIYESNELAYKGKLSEYHFEQILIGIKDSPLIEESIKDLILK